MADFSALKTSIQNYIKQNGNEEITGNLLQQILLSMVSTLGDSAINDLVTALNAETANRVNADGELDGRVTTLQGIVNNIKNGYVYAGIATPSTTPVSGKVFYLALKAGTYTNFGATVVPQGINILKYNGSAWLLDSFLGLDDVPTQGSNNLVKSGGVLDSIIKDGSAFDLSAYNSGTTYADLSAALTALNDLPAAYKKGGMSVKFVQTSDNKYIQARCMAQNFTADVTQWAIAEEGVYVDNPEFVYIKTDKDDKILWAIKKDGDIYLGTGCPQQIKDYIEEKISSLSLDEYENIVSFLNDYLGSDTTLKAMIDEINAQITTKVDKEEGKSLIPTQYIQEIENPEFIKAELDAEQKLLGGIKKDGTYLFNKIESPTLDNLQKEVNDAIEESQEALIEHYDYYNVSKHHSVRDVFNIYTANDGWEQIEYNSSLVQYDALDIYQIGEQCNYSGDTEHSYEALISQRGVAPAIVTPEYVTRRKFTLDEAVSLLPAEILTAFAAGQMICFVDLDDIVEEWQLSESGSWVRVNPYEIKDPEGRVEIKLDNDSKIIAYRKADGTWVECVGIEAPNLGDYVDKEEGKGLIDKNVADSLSYVEDIEGRHEITTDSEGKIISYRKADGTKVENVGVETNNLTLTEQGMNDFQQALKDNGFDVKIKNYNLPKYGTVNIKNETFYLPSDGWNSYANDVVLIQVLDDTTENAHNKLTLSYFYIKSTLTPLPGGGYDRTSVNENSVRLTFYAATQVSLVDGRYYVTSTLEDGAVVESSIEVRQCVDVPPIMAWAVNKSTEHNCLVDIDFGKNYLSGTNLPIGVKYQGSSTLEYRKRNFRFTFYKDSYYSSKKKNKLKLKIGEMVRCSGYNLKANFTNTERVKEDVMNIIFMDIWDKRDIVNRYPWDMKVNPYTGATGMIKGFPIRVNIGNSFYGIHIFGLKKDEANYCLDGDDSGMIVGMTSNTNTCWTGARWQDCEDEMNDDMSESNKEALTIFFDFINSRLYKDANGNNYLSTEITEIDEHFYVTNTLVDGQVTESSVEVENIPFERDTMPERMSIVDWIDYIICLQVFFMPDNNCRNLILYTGADKKKFYPFFYDLDLSWNYGNYKADIMIPTGEPGGSNAGDKSLWINFKNAYWDEIRNRYFELRQNILTIEYISKVCDSVLSNIPNADKSLEYSKWSSGTFDMSNKIKIMKERLQWLDEYYNTDNI